MKKTNYKIALILITIILSLTILYFFITKPKPEKSVPLVGCKKTGCSGQLCVPSDAKDVITNCEWKSEYSCYQQAKCERLPDGQCGFIKDESFQKCLDQIYSELEIRKR